MSVRKSKSNEVPAKEEKTLPAIHITFKNGFPNVHFEGDNSLYIPSKYYDEVSQRLQTQAVHSLDGETCVSNEFLKNIADSYYALKGLKTLFTKT